MITVHRKPISPKNKNENESSKTPYSNKNKNRMIKENEDYLGATTTNREWQNFLIIDKV